MSGIGCMQLTVPWHVRYRVQLTVPWMYRLCQGYIDHGMKCTLFGLTIPGMDNAVRIPRDYP